MKPLAIQHNVCKGEMLCYTCFKLYFAVLKYDTSWALWSSEATTDMHTDVYASGAKGIHSKSHLCEQNQGTMNK